MPPYVPTHLHRHRDRGDVFDRVSDDGQQDKPDERFAEVCLLVFVPYIYTIRTAVLFKNVIVENGRACGKSVIR